MSTKKGKNTIYTVNGFTGSMKEIASNFGINYSTLLSRILKSGMSLEMAISTPVDKSRSIKTPTVLDIGKFHGTAVDVYNWFGILQFPAGCADSGVMIEHLRKWRAPKFYKVGDNYKGSLIAISAEFGIPLSLLQKEVLNGKDPEQVLKERNLIKC